MKAHIRWFGHCYLALTVPPQVLERPIPNLVPSRPYSRPSKPRWESLGTRYYLPGQPGSVHVRVSYLSKILCKQEPQSYRILTRCSSLACVAGVPVRFRQDSFGSRQGWSWTVVCPSPQEWARISSYEGLEQFSTGKSPIFSKVADFF